MKWHLWISSLIEDRTKEERERKQCWGLRLISHDDYLLLAINSWVPKALRWELISLRYIRVEFLFVFIEGA